MSSQGRPRPFQGSIGKAITKTIGNSGSIFPDRLRTQVKVCYIIDASAAPTYRFVFRGNSCFDPGYTSGAAQPAGWTALSAAYSFYRVLWSKIKVQYVNVGGTTHPFVSTIYPSNTSSPFTATPAGLPGVRYGNTRLMSNNGTGGITPNGPGGVANVQYNAMSTKKITGDRSDLDSTFSAAVTANPTQPWYWIHDAATLDAGNFAATDSFVYEITFGVDMEAPKSVEV